MGLSDENLGIPLDKYTGYKEGDPSTLSIQPGALFEILRPLPNTLPSRQSKRKTPKVPAESIAPEEYKLPKWARMDKRKQFAPVYYRVIGWLKITAWMKKIAQEVLDKHFQDWKNGVRRMDPRRVRREFRSRVTAIKRKQRWERISLAKEEGGLGIMPSQELIDEVDREGPVKLPWVQKIPKPRTVPRPKVDIAPKEVDPKAIPGTAPDGVPKPKFKF